MIKFPAIFIFKIRFMRQDFFLFIRIQIFDIHAAAIRTKKLSLAAGVITGCLQLVSHPPPAAFVTFFLVLAHAFRLVESPSRLGVLKLACIPGVKLTCFHYSQFNPRGQL
jgi:hypothetical protein